MDAPLILASTSPYRRALLERLGLGFTAVAPTCDEEALKTRWPQPRELAEGLAFEKARCIADAHPEATVIGSDQVACCDDRVLGKPGDRQRASEQLAALAGRSHRLITAVSVIADGQVLSHTDITVLHMRALDPATIARYVAADDPVDCAGAYKLEQRGIALFERIESADHSAITGLPLIALCGILRQLGYIVP
ncbi:MAG: Maf family protein [Planctomycetota bacterium]